MSYKVCEHKKAQEKSHITYRWIWLVKLHKGTKYVACRLSQNMLRINILLGLFSLRLQALFMK